MKALLAIFITIGLLAACWIVSALVYFDLSWILIGLTSLWAAIDSSKIELHRYKLSISCRPVALFGCCYLLWIFVFPWYLWARFKIKAGEAALKEETLENVGPVKRFFRRFSRVTERVVEWCLIVLVGLKFAFLFFCIEESWRGQRVWENYKHELEAKGETFDWDAMIPPRVPDSKNFFSAPMMSEWFVKPSGKIIIGDDIAKRLNYSNSTPAVVIAEVTINLPGSHLNSPKADVSLRFDDFKSRLQARELIQNIVGPFAFGARGNNTFIAHSLNPDQIKPTHIVLETDKKLTVRDLIVFFSDNKYSSELLIFRPSETNSYHILTSFCAASDYLKWSDRFRNDFDLMREALKRPYARMEGDYSDPTRIPLPNYSNIRAVAQTLAQRAQCHLLLGQPEKALSELTFLNDLRRLTEGAPTGKPMSLAAAMINVALTGLYVDTIADGFRLHAWKEPQIAVLQKQLEQINLAPFLKEAFHGEQVCAWRTVQTMMAEFETRRVPNATLWRKIKNLQRPNILKGIFILNAVKVVEMNQKIIDSIDLSQKIILPQKAAELQREVDALDHAHLWQVLPYKFLAVIFEPNFTRAVQTFTYNQTKTDETQIVCALERYHFVHGNYPKTLNELVPQFIDKLPHDIIGGQPLKYRQINDQFLLYSIGWNETDDGGQFNPSYDQADWVWQ
jgi:hypothetical protein